MALIRIGFLPSAFVFLAIPASAQQASAPGISPPATETIAIRVHEGTALSLDLSPDGGTIVFDLLGQLWEMPSAGGEARPLTSAVRDTAVDYDPSYSPDGRRIVFRGERRGRTGLWLLEPGSDRPRQLTQLVDPDGHEGSAAWSPDGSRIAFVRLIPPDSALRRWRSRLALLDLAKGESSELPVAEVVGPNLRDPAWDPTGRRIAVVARSIRAPFGGRIWMVNVGSGEATPLTPETSGALAPAFAPGGRHLAFLAPDSTTRIQVWVLDLESPGAAAVRLTSHDDLFASRVRWTPDGKSLVYSADGRIWKIPSAGGTPSEIPFTVNLAFERRRWSLPPAPFPQPGVRQTVRNFMGMALSPDSRTVALLALGKLWIMPVGGEPRALADVPFSARHLTWSADGATLVWTAGPWLEEDLFATDLARGSTRRLTALPGREDYPAFSPDGRQLSFFHHPVEDSTILRVVSPEVRELSDPARGTVIPAEAGAEAYWTPASDGLLYVTGGFSPDPTRATLITLSGARRPVERMPDSPLFLQWTGKSIFFLRHSRVWRAPFDSGGMIAPAEPLGSDPAMYLSASRDGTLLYISDGGLRIRSPDGREQRLGWPLSYTPPVPEPMLLRNVRVIDGTGAPATPPQDLLIERGRIARLAPAGSLPATARVLDAGGRFLMPGLTDLHAHEYRPDLLPGFPYFGVTTIRDQGSPIGQLISYADVIAGGQLEGPRVGYGGFQFYSDWAYDTEDGQGVEPEADSAHLVRAIELARTFGSQHIKTRTFRRWDINARFVLEAHRRGMRVTGHCAHLLPLIAAGIDAKEHAGFCEPRSDGLIYDDLVQLYRAAGVGVVPTIAYASFAVQMRDRPEQLEGDAELAPFLPPQNSFGWMLGLDSTRREMFAGFAERARQATTRLARAGVMIGTGTDIWQIPTGVHMEMEELVAAGLSPLQAIQAATGNAARILGAEADIGTVAVGKLADLVILDADPLQDIRNTRRIRAVIQAGRQVDRDAIRKRYQDRSSAGEH